MIGKQILHYTITAKLGEGGMGVVYKAEDTKLERTIALKFLSQSLIGGKEENERFKREAKAAAALNHPNIAHVYAVDEVDGQAFIAMEHIEGQELKAIIDDGPLSIDDAIDYATQTSAGLQAAHEKGVVHRDIKSANIMVTDKGVVKIMDFGLAKLSDRTKMTMQGTTLGTAAYMSPEQAQGAEVDHRSDIWSLGVVLYEILSGQMPFKGDYEQAVIYAILHQEPEPLTALRSGLPIALDGIIAKTLAKDPKTRYQHVDELPADLKALDTAALSRSRISAVGQPSEGSRLPWIIAALSLAALAIFVFMSKDSAPPKTMRVNLSALTSQKQSLLRTGVQTLALSPDGNTLVYSLSADGQSQLYLRSLNDFDAIPITGTSNAQAPFFSPDGQWIGFLADGKIKKVALAGGTVATICDAPAFRGASWGPDNTILFSPEFSSGLMAVAATGGAVRQVSTLDSTQLERTHRWPQVLPDGKWVLYTIGDQNNPQSYGEARLAMQSLETGEQHILDVRGEMARYVEPGFLIVARKGNLLAAPFSLKEFKTTQEPISVLDHVDGRSVSGISYFTFSQTGSLVYISGIRNTELELVWVDMQGKVEPLPLQSGAYRTPRLSPDGARLAVEVGERGQHDIWLYHLKTGAFSRHTFIKVTGNPVWSPDGKKIYMGSRKGMLVKPVDGSSAASLILHQSKNPQIPIDITPDATKLLFNRLTGRSMGALVVLDLSKPSQSAELFPPGFLANGGYFSPDGRFLAYGANETGMLEVFVTSFPDLDGKWQVSSEGGLSPLWSRDGKTLYYVSPQAKMMAVSIATDAVFSPGKPRELFDVSQMSFINSTVPNYDISPDGKRFIMIRNARENSGAQVFNVILNWTAELQQRFGAGD